MLAHSTYYKIIAINCVMEGMEANQPISFGGNLGILKIASERANELKQLHDAIVDPNKQRSALQLLPHHMRRRAASHNPKRLPLSIRQNHQKQTEACQTDEGKRSAAPSRRYRRRARHLLLEYNRRQSRPATCRWLETHVWHAKRFHMRRHWGYMLPHAATEKTFRTCYRASARGCLAHDVSFLCHVQLSGPEHLICAGLARLGYTGAADGRSYTTLLLHHADCRGHTLAPVGVLWCSGSSEVSPSSERVDPAGCQSPVRQLLLWTHPAAFSALVDQLVFVLELEAAADERLVEEASGRRSVDEVKLAPRRPHLLARYLSSGVGRGVCLLVLQDRLGRLRLTGPESQHVLQACLRPVRDSSLSSWLPDSATLSLQADLWHQLSAVQSPGELPAQCVLALCVQDPRQNLPSTRQSTRSGATDELFFSSPLCNLPEGASLSPFWSARLRHHLSVSKLSDNVLNRSRSRQLVSSQLQNQLPPVPLLLLQTCHPPGWDILLPSGWAMSFWTAFKYRGVRVGGIQEANRLALECGLMRFPDDFPETSVGRSAEEEEYKERRAAYFRRPPSKRVNLSRLALPEYVFSAPWRPLLELEDGQPLLVCRCWWAPCRCLREPATPLLRPVRVVSLTRGVPRSGALLCLPEPCDRPDLTPREPPGADGARQQRMQERGAWRARLSSERRARRVLRRRGDQQTLSAAEELLNTEREETAKARELAFLPKKDCLPSRKVVGVVRLGDFCLSEAVGVGVGLVSAAIFEKPGDVASTRLLFRNTSSPQYHWCRLQPITRLAL